MDYLKEFERNIAYYFSEELNYPFAKPYWVYISLSHRCTYTCQMCGVVKILKGYELPFDIVKRSLDVIASWNWDSVVMLTGGEPFLRKDIFDIIRYSVSKGIATECVSNGSLIDEDLAKEIVGSGLSNIAISLDGANSKTHDFIREEGSFKKALAALSNLVSAKRRNKKGPQISVWTTIMKENVTELFDIIPLVRDLGVECLVYHPVIVAQDDMQNTSSSAPFWIRGDNLIVLKEQIDKIVDYSRKKGLVAFLHDPYLWLDYFKGTLTKQQWKCNPFVFVNIGPDGEVRSCGASFGNVKEISLDECLHTPEAYRARAKMKVCPKPCLQTCWAHPESDSLTGIVNILLSKIKDNPNRKIFIQEAAKILDNYEQGLKDIQACLV